MTVVIAILVACALATVYLARHPNRVALMLVVAAAAGSIVYALAAVAVAATPPTAFCVDNQTIDASGDPVLEEFLLDASIGGAAYSYEGPDATTVTGFTAFPDTDGDIAPGAPKEPFLDAFYGEDDLVDIVNYDVSELNIMKDTYTVVAGPCGEGPGALPPPENHSPLCYSTFSDDVVFFESKDLNAVLSAPGSHWWVPSAVKGNVNDIHVTNIGGYHLVCNPASTLKATGTKLGDDGKTVVSDAFAAGLPWWWEILQ